MQRHHLSAAVTVVLGYAVAGAHAATAAPAGNQSAAKSVHSAQKSSAPPHDSVTNLETVKVTARRYEETLQDMPIAVTALTARALTDNNVQNLADLQGLVPNLQIGAPDFCAEWTDFAADRLPAGAAVAACAPATAQPSTTVTAADRWCRCMVILVVILMISECRPGGDQHIDAGRHNRCGAVTPPVRSGSWRGAP